MNRTFWPLYEKESAKFVPLKEAFIIPQVLGLLRSKVQYKINTDFYNK